MESKWYCYILRSTNPDFKNHTYNGKTNNPKRRLRQHNGEICGGAKATSKIKPVEIYCLIEGFETEKDALRCEWRIKHPTNKKKRPYSYCGPIGRIKGLLLCLQSDKWTRNCTKLNNETPITITIVKEMVEYLGNDLPDYVSLVIVDEINSALL